jgi:ABC-2 type transport system permease protein
MNPTNLGSTIKRILSQLRHDHRTIGLLLVVPVVLLTLLYFMFKTRPGTFQGVGLIMLGFFPFVIMFLLTSIAMLRERTSGTLERLLTTPMGKLDLLFAYGIAFGVAAAVQATVAGGVAYLLLDLNTQGSIGLCHHDRIANAVLGCGARVVRLRRSPAVSSRPCRFMPIVVIPSCSCAVLFVARDQMSLAAGDQQRDADVRTRSRRCRRSASTRRRPARSWRDPRHRGRLRRARAQPRRGTLRRRTQ